MQYHHLHAVTNLSNSIIRWRWSLSRKAEPLSSSFGAKKMRTMPSRCAPESLFTCIVMVKGTCCKWVNLCVQTVELKVHYVTKIEKVYLAKTSPRGTKSIPFQRAECDIVIAIIIVKKSQQHLPLARFKSLCCQWVFMMLGRPPSELTWMAFTVIPGYVNWASEYGCNWDLCSWKISST